MAVNATGMHSKQQCHAQTMFVCPMAPILMSAESGCWFELEVPKLFASVMNGTIANTVLGGMDVASK